MNNARSCGVIFFDTITDYRSDEAIPFRRLTFSPLPSCCFQFAEGALAALAIRGSSAQGVEALDVMEGSPLPQWEPLELAPYPSSMGELGVLNVIGERDVAKSAHQFVPAKSLIV